MNNTAAKEGASSCRTKERDRSILSNSKFGDPRRFVRNYFPFLFLLTFHRVFPPAPSLSLSFSFLFPGSVKWTSRLSAADENCSDSSRGRTKAASPIFIFFSFSFRPMPGMLLSGGDRATIERLKRPGFQFS